MLCNIGTTDFASSNCKTCSPISSKSNLNPSGDGNCGKRNSLFGLIIKTLIFLSCKQKNSL